MPRPVRRPVAVAPRVPGSPILTGRPDHGPFSPVVAGGMVVVGVLCFVGFVVVLALARSPGAHDGGAHALSRSAVGFAGLVQVLRDTGTPAVVSRGAGLADTPGVALLVLTPPSGKKVPADVTELVPADSVLLVLPKWRTTALEDHEGWVRDDGLLPSDDVLGVLPPGGNHPALQRRTGTATPLLARAGGFAAAVSAGPVDRLQVLDGGRLTPLLRDGAGGTVLGQRGDLYVLSDPDLLDNLGLATEPGAAGAVALLHGLVEEGGTVAFDVSLNGFGRGHDPLRAALEPPLLGATLCAAATALLAGLLSAVRFGPAQRSRRSFDLGKAALAANSAALLLRAGRAKRLAEPYAVLVRRATLRALRLPRRLSPAEADDALDRVARQRAPGAERLAVLLDAARAVRDRAGLLAAARRLHAWQKEVERADR